MNGIKIYHNFIIQLFNDCSIRVYRSLANVAEAY